MNRVRSAMFLGLVVLASASIAVAAQPRGAPGGGPGGGRPGGGMGLLGLASDPAVQKKIGIEDKKDALEKLATTDREANRDAMRKAFEGMGNFRDMEPAERAKFGEKMQQAREKAQKATAEKVKGLLGEAKYNQLVEIRAGLTLTRTGPTAVLEPDIAALLKLTKKQKQEIKKVVDEYTAARTKLFEGLRGQRGQRGGAPGGAAVAGPQVILVAGAPAGDRRAAFEKIQGQVQELRKKANAAISKILTAPQKAKIKALMAAVEGLELQGRGRGGAQGGRQRGGGQGGDAQGGRRPRGGGPPDA